VRSKSPNIQRPREISHVPRNSVYPDSNQVGIFDAAKRSERRFGALFHVGAASSGYGGGSATITPPAPGPTSETGRREGT
jgi:hypothetical protein